MKGLSHISLLFLLVALACNKQDAPDCFKSAGFTNEIGQLRLEHAVFNSVEVRQNIRLHLVQDTINYLLVRAGRNLLPKISTEVQGQNLIIKNDNRCNWVRSYDNVPEVEVHFKELRYLRCFGFGDVTASDTIRGHALDILHYGASKLLLPLQYFSLFYDGDQVGTATLSGSLYILYYSSQKFNRLNGTFLHTQYFEGIHNSERDAEIVCSDWLSVKIENKGNLYITGKPRLHVRGRGPGKALFR